MGMMKKNCEILWLLFCALWVLLLARVNGWQFDWIKVFANGNFIHDLFHLYPFCIFAWVVERNQGKKHTNWSYLLWTKLWCNVLIKAFCWIIGVPNILVDMKKIHFFDIQTELKWKYVYIYIYVGSRRDWG